MGVPNGIISEVAYQYSQTCFTGMLTVSNGVLGLHVFSELSFLYWHDWAKYFLALVQLFVFDLIIALIYCGFELRMLPSTNYHQQTSATSLSVA